MGLTENLIKLRGYRKFVAYVLALFSITLAVALGWIEGDNFTDAVKWISGLFLGANAVTHFKKQPE